MRKIVKILLASVLIVFSLFTLLSYCVLSKKNHTFGGFSLTLEQAEKNHSIIATYYVERDSINKRLAGLLPDEICVERIMVRNEYKYIYYSPSYYSKEFYINNTSFNNVPPIDVKKTLTAIVGNDTLLNVHLAVSPLKTIPEIIKMYSVRTYLGDYHLKKIYKENLEIVPKTPILTRLSFGPWFDKYYE